MRRTLWFGAGVASAVYVSGKVRRAAERLTPVGLADQLLAWGVGVRVFVDDVRAGSAQREAELRRALELGEPARQQALLARGGQPHGYPDVA